MTKRLAILAAGAALALASPAAAMDGHAHSAIEQVDQTGFSGKAARWRDLYVASQPDEAALARLAEAGVVTVINLRTPAEMAELGFDEPAAAQQLGMTYVQVPLNGRDYPHTPEALEKVSQAIAAAEGAPVLLHCASSARASHMFAAWLVREKGLKVSEAIALARQIGMSSLPVEDLLDTTFEMSLPAEAG